MEWEKFIWWLIKFILCHLRDDDDHEHGHRG